MTAQAHTEALAAEETRRMVREEVILRPARRAAIFVALVLAGLTGTSVANGDQVQGDQPGSGFVRAELVAGR